MIRSTTILTALFVFSAALTANAYDGASGHSDHDHSSQEAEQHSQPSTSSTIQPFSSFPPVPSQPGIQTLDSTPRQSRPLTPHRQQFPNRTAPPERSRSFYNGQQNSARYGGGLAPNRICPDGTCGQFSNRDYSPHRAQQPSCFRPYRAPYSRNHHAASTPYQQSPLQLNITNSPYHRSPTIPHSTTPRYQRQPTFPYSARPFSRPANNPYYN